MALVIEDGTMVAGANSYVAISDVRQYALDRNLALPTTDSAVEVLIHKAMDYLESLRDRYRGEKVDYTIQSLQWPRADVTIDNNDFPVNVIPNELKWAACQLCVEINTIDPLPTTTGPVAKRKKVDVLEIDYDTTPNTPPPLPVMPKVNVLLAPLLKPGGVFRLTRI